jgi:hypothetical protein
MFDVNMASRMPESDCATKVSALALDAGESIVVRRSSMLCVVTATMNDAVQTMYKV